MQLKYIYIILAIHWLTDFILQTDWQAKNKSSRWDALLGHTCVYSFFWLIALSSFLGDTTGGDLIALAFALVTFFIHTATDYVTSRINSRLWKAGQVHWFFVSVGFDQILHYLQLIWTWQWLVK